MNEQEIKEQKLLIFETSINSLEQLLTVAKQLLESKNVDNNVAIATIDCSRLAVSFEEKVTILNQDGKMTTKDIYTALAQTHVELADAIYNTIKAHEAKSDD
jgi:hypothetical protein